MTEYGHIFDDFHFNVTNSLQIHVFVYIFQNDITQSKGNIK